MTLPTGGVARLDCQSERGSFLCGFYVHITKSIPESQTIVLS